MELVMSPINCIKPSIKGKFIVVLNCGHRVTFDSAVDPVVDFIYPHRLICIECTEKMAKKHNPPTPPITFNFRSPSDWTDVKFTDCEIESDDMDEEV